MTSIARQAGTLESTPDRRPMVHALKTDPQTYDDVVSRRKKFEIRKNDRDFRVGDVLSLCRTESTGAQMAAGAELVYSGVTCSVRVTHILEGYGLQVGWVVMSIEHVTFPANCSPFDPDWASRAVPADGSPQCARTPALSWQCLPPKGKAWGPGTTLGVARQLHAEGYKVRALGEIPGDPFAASSKT